MDAATVLYQPFGIFAATHANLGHRHARPHSFRARQRYVMRISTGKSRGSRAASAS
jgi:hypothetical protein